MLIVCRALFSPQMRREVKAAGRLKVGVNTSGAQCGAQRAHQPWLQGGGIAVDMDRNFPALHLRYSSSHQLPQGCPSSSGCLMEAEAVRRSQLVSIQSLSHMSISHPPRLPALARLLILTNNMLIPHQQGCITSWQALSNQPQLQIPIWAISCLVEPTKKSPEDSALF